MVTVPRFTFPSPVEFIYYSSDLVFVAKRKYHPKSTQGGKGEMPGKGGGGDLSRDHGGTLLTDLFPLICLATQDHLPRDRTTHSGLDPHTSVINQENVP